MTLTKEQLKWLRWLYDNGESAWMDQWGKLVANGVGSYQGTQVSWLNLILKGLVEARDNRFRITAAGYKRLGLQPKIEEKSLGNVT